MWRHGIEVTVVEKKLNQADEVGEKIIEVLGRPFIAKDWMSMNRNLFAAFKLEKIGMFICVALINSSGSTEHHLRTDHGGDGKRTAYSHSEIHGCHLTLHHENILLSGTGNWICRHYLRCFGRLGPL